MRWWQEAPVPCWLPVAVAWTCLAAYPPWASGSFWKIWFRLRRVVLQVSPRRLRGSCRCGSQGGGGRGPGELRPELLSWRGLQTAAMAERRDCGGPVLPFCPVAAPAGVTEKGWLPQGAQWPQAGPLSRQSR